MDIFGKYLGEQVAKQAQTVNRVLEAQRAAALAAQRMRQGAQAAAPVVYTPPPRAAAPSFPSFGGSVGQTVARAAVQAASAAPAALSPAPPPPPTFGQRIAQQIVDQTQQATAQVRTPFMEQASIAPVAPLAGFSQQVAEPVEPWQTWQSPEGDRVVMPGSYTPPETWQTMGGPITAPDQIENARTSPLAYDNQAPEVQSQIVVPDAPAIRGVGDVARSVGGDVLGIARQAEQQANRNLDQALAPTPLNPVDTVFRLNDQGRGRDAAGGSSYANPYNPTEGGINTDPITVAEANEREGRWQGIEGVRREASDRLGDLWTIIQYGGQEAVEGDNPLGRILRTARDEGWGPAVKEVFGDIWDGNDIPRIINTNSAIDTYIKIRTGTYSEGDNNLILDAASLTTGAITEGLQATLGELDSVFIPPDPERGITTGGDVSFVEWYEATSTVVYADGTTANVFNSDIENNPDAFEGATIVANDERANTAYTEGVDTDGDGEPDMIGADAVRKMYEADADGLGTFIWQVGMDPLTYIPFVTVGGAKIRNIGRARVARGVTDSDIVIGRGIEGVGKTIQRASQFVDEATSFGAGIVLDRVAMPFGRKIGDITRLTRESNASRIQTDPAEVGSTVVGIARRMDGQEPTIPVTRWTPEQPDPVVPVTRWTPEQPQRPLTQAEDVRTTGSEALSTRPPAPRSRPTENLDPGPDLRTPDGGTVSTRVADGEGGVIERSVNPEGGVIPVSRSANFPTRTTPTPAGTIDTTDVPRRFNEPIVRSAMVNGPDVTQVAVDTMRASGRFIDQTAMGRAISEAQGVDAATIDHVLATADFASEWNDALRVAGGQPVPFTPSRNMTVDYANAQAVIHQPWATTSGQRTRLYQTGDVVSRLPASPTPQQMAAAERYADLVDTHRFWNPQAVSDPGFQRAMAQASEIRKRLDEMDYEGRPTGNIRRGNLLGAGQTPQARITPATDPSLNGQATDSGFANAAQVRKVLLPGENDFGEIAGYPVIDQRQGGRNGDMVQEVRIDEDTTVTVRPVREANVPRALREANPDATSIWAKADLNDPSVKPGEVTRTAPTMTEAVEQVAAEAQARGLVNAEAPTAEASPLPPEPEVWPNQPTRNNPNRALGEANPPDPIYKDLYDRAKAATSKEEGIAIFRSYGEGKYGPRDASVREGQRRNRAGNLVEGQGEVYTATREGRGWQTVDRLMEGFARDWDELRPSGRLAAPSPVTEPVTTTDATPPPDLDPAPNVTEATARVTTPNPVERAKADIRKVWGDINPENVTPALKKAVDNRWIADGRTAVAFQKNVVDARHWTDRDTEMILEALNDFRVTNGSVDPLDSAVNLANPATKRLLDEAERLARATDAVAVQNSIIRSADSSADAKKAARAHKKQLEDKVVALRKELGWTDSNRKQAPKRGQTTTEAEAQRRIERARPSDPQGPVAKVKERLRPGETVRVRTYVDSLKKVKSLEFGDAPVNALSMDAQGLVRFHGAILTDDEIATLTRHTFDDGDTFLDRWNRYLSEARGKQASTIRDEDAVSASLAAAMTDYEALVKVVYKDKRWVEIVKTILKPLTASTSYLREKILGSWLSAPRYIGTQVLGNPILMSIGGYGDAVARADMYKGVIRSYKETHEMTSLVGGDVFRNGNPVLNADRIANTWGTARAPEVRRHVSSGTDITKDYGVVEGFMRRHNMKPLARPAAAVFGDTRVIRVGAAFDMVSRDAVYATAFDRQVKNAITDFRIQTNDLLMQTGMSRSRAVGIVESFRTKYPNGFTSNHVRDFFGDYLPNGKAERLARDWQAAVNATNVHARNEVTRVLFSGKETNLDAMLKSVVMFHYFMSRQYFFLIRQALHHPGLLNAYRDYQVMMEEYYEAHKDQMPSWLQGFMRVMISPIGTVLYIKPTSLLSVGNIFGDTEIDFGDDKTWLQSQLGKVDDVLMVNPIIGDILNVLGYLGDDRDIDPLRLMREVEAFNLVTNWAIRTGLIHDIDYRFGNPIADLGNQLRSTLSGVLPGSDEVDFTSTAQREQRQLRAIIVDEAARDGIDAETAEGAAQIDAILADPSHPIYERAMGRYLWGETANLIARVTPFLASIRPQTRQVNELGQDLLTNTTAAQRTLINSTEEARALRTQETGYYAIGDTRTANVADMIYMDVAFSENVFFNVTVDGVTYEHYEIEKMSDEERQDLAKAWLSENNLYYIWQRTQDGQDQFLAQPENAEYATFKRWQGEIADYPGGLEAYWEQAATENESARAYLDGLDPDLSEFQREKALRSKWGYLAIRGVPIGFNTNRDGETYAVSDYRSPEGKPTNGYDPVNIANQPPTPTEYEPYESDYNENLRKDLDSYQRRRAEDEVVLQQIYADWGMSPDTRLATADYDTSKAIKKEFTARTGGEYVTNPAPAVEEYFRWRDENPTGTLEDYIKWNDRQYIRGLPQDFSEEQARPPEGAERDADAYDLWTKTEYRGD